MTQDYCTAFPEGWPTWLGGTGIEWQHCCKAHDAFYAQQTTMDVLAYLGAHYDLAVCVSSVSWSVAAVMFTGLVTLGTPLLINRHNRTGRTKP